jgi:hypothetical protein
MSFKADLQFGQKYEDIFINQILGSPEGLDRPSGKFSLYDFCIGEEKYEIKADRQTHKTGNFCIETHCNGQASGISVTQAKYYGYFVVYPDGEYDIYNIPTRDIVGMLMDKKFSRSMKGGDGFRSLFYLFDKNLFEQYKVYERPVESETPVVCGDEAL